MMRIAIEAQRLFRPHKHGMEVVALETIRALQEIDHINNYRIYAAQNSDDTVVKPTQNFEIEKLPKAFYPLWEQLKLPAAVKRYSPDILHCTANTAPLRYPGKLIITLHDLIFLEKAEFSGTAYQVFGNMYRRFIVPRVARKCDHIITVSEYSKKVIIQRLGIHENKISVVHNGVHPSFKPITDQQLLGNVKKIYNLPEQFFLHIGNPAPRKNTRGVLKAYNRYRELTQNPWPLVITGSKDDWLHALCDELKLSGLKQHLICTGFIATEHLPVVYNLATVFLYPSLNEGFGLPVIESMACGTAVITSENSCLPEIAGGAALLVNPDHAGSIADAMLLLHENEGKRKELVEKGFLNAQRFTWRRSAEECLKVYQHVAGIR